MKSRILSSLLLLLAFPLAAVAAPLGTAFTYQGRLDQNNAPANGIFDLKFDLYDVASGGSTVAPTVLLSNQAITGGLLSADLDFGGTAVFDGRAFWLEISARASGSPTYVLLPGRTAIRPTPYSIHALSAAAVKDGGVTSASLAAGSVTSAKLAPSAVGLTQLNAAGAPASGQVLGYNGAGLSWVTPSGGGGGGPWLLNGANAYYNGGNVGIGTTTPARKLTVFHAGYGISQTDGSVIMGTYVGGSVLGGWIGTQSNHPLHFEVNGGSPRMTLATNGNFGIGTTSPARKLTVFQAGYGIEQTDGTVRMGTYVGGSNTGGWIGTQSNHPFYVEVNGSPKMFIATDGNVGIGTTTPNNSKLSVAGPIYTTGNFDALGSITVRGNISSVGGVSAETDVTATRLILRADPAAPTNAAVLCSNAGVTNFVPYNTATNKPLNIVVTDASVRALTIRGGADLAEPFAMSHEGVEPGTVVVIDAENPGKLKASSEAYDKKVAGIVSGANGIQPGISMIQEDKLEAGENVALSGRVYVKADTSAGPIEPGDMLTTSSHAGHAMKAADHDQAQGAIIGKAMTPLADGDGMVLVLVTLQ